jgi:hypothetical protein
LAIISVCNSTLEDKVCEFWEIENTGIDSQEGQALSSEERKPLQG